MKTSNRLDLFKNHYCRGNYLFALFPFLKMGIKVDFIYIKIIFIKDVFYL